MAGITWFLDGREHNGRNLKGLTENIDKDKNSGLFEDIYSVLPFCRIIRGFCFHIEPNPNFESDNY